MSDELKVFWRDASWFDSPGKAGTYHFRDGDSIRSVCGVPILNDDGPTAVSVPEHRRCRRKACAKLWPSTAVLGYDPTKEDTK